MKKIMPLTALSIFFYLCAAFAHPPSDIVITYDRGKKALKAVIMHNVGDPMNHYIKKVDVSLNGKVIITQSLIRQDNNENQTVSYLIPDAEEGDLLAVEGYCSISGKLKREITAGGEKKTPAP